MAHAPSPPLVSVIVPTYNRARLLRETVDSVLAQTYPCIELIVVDDGSTDETPRVLAEYGDRIVAIRKTNAGGTAARNTGLQAASGDYVNFVDHDDLLLPNKIEQQVRLLEASPSLGWAHCGFWRMEPDGRYIDRVTLLPEGDVLAPLLRGCFIWSGAPVIRRTVLEQVGPFNTEAWSSDAEMWLRIALAGHRLGCVQQPLGAYRIMPDSTMADVARTERMDMPTYDRVFADPRMTEEGRRIKPDAYFNQRFWLACRYFAVDQIADARRNLTAALGWCPELLRQRARLFHLFLASALDSRVSDPLAFIDRVFDHLPADVGATLAGAQEEMKAWACLALALRHCGRGELDEAAARLRQAIALHPPLAASADAFAGTVADFALRLPVDPDRFVEAVMASLPPEAAVLRSQRGRIRGEVAVLTAFQGYAAGQRRGVPRALLTAVRHRPSLIANRGVSAMFVKSLMSGAGRAS